MEWMILPYRRYFDFAGRSRRREYWMFVLFTVLVNVAIDAAFGTRTANYGADNFNVAVAVKGGIGGAISALFSLLSFIPSLAVSVRRLHDQDRSGWLLLLVLVPFLGWFALLVLFCLEGTRGPNRYGSDPKGRVETTGVFD